MLSTSCTARMRGYTRHHRHPSISNRLSDQLVAGCPRGRRPSVSQSNVIRAHWLVSICRSISPHCFSFTRWSCQPVWYAMCFHLASRRSADPLHPCLSRSSVTWWRKLHLSSPPMHCPHPLELCHCQSLIPSAGHDP